MSRPFDSRLSWFIPLRYQFALLAASLMAVTLVTAQVSITAKTDEIGGVPYAVLYYVAPASNVVTLWGATNLCGPWTIMDCVTNDDSQAVTNEIAILGDMTCFFRVSLLP